MLKLSMSSNHHLPLAAWSNFASLSAEFIRGSKIGGNIQRYLEVGESREMICLDSNSRPLEVLLRDILAGFEFEEAG